MQATPTEEDDSSSEDDKSSSEEDDSSSEEDDSPSVEDDSDEEAAPTPAKGPAGKAATAAQTAVSSSEEEDESDEDDDEAPVEVCQPAVVGMLQKTLSAWFPIPNDACKFAMTRSQGQEAARQAQTGSRWSWKQFGTGCGPLTCSH